MADDDRNSSTKNPRKLILNRADCIPDASYSYILAYDEKVGKLVRISTGKPASRIKPGQVSRNMKKRKRIGDNILLLWEWREAELSEGFPYDNSVGVQIKHRKKGDTLFVCATRNNELFLLGAIQVRQVKPEGRRLYRAIGRCITGPFRIIPLADMKWKLRFEGQSDRLSKSSPIAMQVMSHRRLSPPSAELLLSVFKILRKRQAQLQGVFGQEGRLMRKMVSVRERDPKIRKAAILKHGRQCMVCGFDFAKVYGEETRDCIHVHHLHLVAHAPTRGRRAKLEDVIIACPNCHSALHCQEDPSAWKRLKKMVESSNGR